MTQDFDPPIGEAQQLTPMVRRILAPNPSPLTFRGTNTYLLGQSALAVIDPGPNDDTHLEAILKAAGQTPITHILVTHAHLDHSPLARPLAARTGAPIYAFGPAQAGRSPLMTELAASGVMGGGEGIDAEFTPDITLTDDQVITGADWTLTALWTPGHLSNHMCFATQNQVFSGDHVMSWSSSLISPPDGDLTAFMASCRRLQQRTDQIYFPGHGAPVEDPAARLDWLITHRLTREAQILEALYNGTATAAQLTRTIYTGLADHLLLAAERNVLAHLIDLSARSLVKPNGPLAAQTAFSVIT